MTQLKERTPCERQAPDEQAARRTLRRQVARLELELSAIVANTFPYLRSEAHTGAVQGPPRLLTLQELECARDQLAGQVQQARKLVDDRREFERRSRALLEQMSSDPAQHKFASVGVRDLGQGSCGVWRVRPRLGLLGMLAGWWQLKLSSGCPCIWGLQLSCSPQITRQQGLGHCGPSTV